MENFINQLVKLLDIHHKRLGELKGALFHAESIFQNHETKMKTYFGNAQNITGREIIRTSLIISDLTGDIINGGVKMQNINSSYSVNKDNFDNELRLMLYRQSGYTIAQGYESFFRFVKDCALLIINDNETLDNLITNDLPEKKHAEKLANFKNRKAVNYTYLDFISKAYPAVEDFLLTNRRKIDYKKYLEVLKFVRDKFSHSLGIFNVSESEYKKFIGDTVRKKIVTAFFPITLNEQEAEFKIDFKAIELHFRLIAEISFQLYKLICIERQSKWERHYNPTTKQHELY